jgi:tetratricopeptide (TPR) repeat protein
MLAMNPVAAVRDEYAARNYSAVVQSLRDVPRDVILQTPELGYLLADSARRAGGVADVLPLIASVVEAAREQDDMDVLCRALNLQGVLLMDAGHRQAAERAWCDLVIVATAADNSQYVARASNNLGVAAIVDMRLETAITSFQRAISAYLRLGYAKGCAQSHQNLGIVHRELDHPQDAHTHFQLAITFANSADCMDDVARAEQEMALLMVYAHEDLQRAEELARHALERFAELKQPAGTAEALRVNGIVALARRSPVEAGYTLNSALHIARDMKLRLLEAETLLGLAAAARLQPDAPTSYNLQQQALAIFQQIGAPAWGEQVQRRMTALVA